MTQERDRERQLAQLVHDCLVALEISNALSLGDVEFTLDATQLETTTRSLTKRARALLPDYEGVLPVEDVDAKEQADSSFTKDVAFSVWLEEMMAGRDLGGLRLETLNHSCGLLLQRLAYPLDEAEGFDWFIASGGPPVGECPRCRQVLEGYRPLPHNK